jgi:hypothetical protein
VVAFLRWHNLKEDPDERIVTSPLLWLPVELVKRKGVRDQYVIQCTAGEAEFNPVLRHSLSQLYGIELPDTVDLGKVSLADIHADLLSKIHRSEPAVELRLVEKASIRWSGRKRCSACSSTSVAAHPKRAHDRQSWLPPYSYARDDYRPLGKALFEHYVVPASCRSASRRAHPAQPAHGHQAPAASSRKSKIGYVLEESSGHRYAWDLDLTQVTLANFNYKKMSLVRDYAQLLEQSNGQPGLRPRLFDRAARNRRQRAGTAGPPSNGAWYRPTPRRTPPSAWRGRSAVSSSRAARHRQVADHHQPDRRLCRPWQARTVRLRKAGRARRGVPPTQAERAGTTVQPDP